MRRPRQGAKAEAGQAAEVTGAESVAAGLPLAASGPQATIHPDSFFGLSIIDASEKYLRMVRRAQHTAAIAEALARGGLKRPDEGTLSSILVRAAKGRVVIKVGKAMWGLPEWYPKVKDTNGDAPRKAAKRARRRGAAEGRSRESRRAPTEALNQPKAWPPAPQNGGGPGSLSPFILEILKEAGKPIHAKDITGRLNSQGHTTSRATVESQLNRWASKGKVRKTAPSTFAVVS